MNVFEKTKGRVWMRRVRSNGSLGRARPRLLEMLENSLVCSKEESDNRKRRTLELETIDKIVKGIPTILCDEIESEKVIGGRSNKGKFFTVLVSNELTKSIICEATSASEASAFRRGLKKLLKRYRDLCFAHRNIKDCTPKLSSSETSKDRIMQVWAKFFENCTKMGGGIQFDLSQENEEEEEEEEKDDIIVTTFDDSWETYESNATYDETNDAENMKWGEYIDEGNETNDAAEEMKWEECIDEHTNSTYYHNHYTGESLWKEDVWETCLDENTDRTYYYNKVTGESLWEEDIWETCFDENSCLTYYYNRITDESVWKEEEKEDEEGIEEEKKVKEEDEEWIDYGRYGYAVQEQSGEGEYLKLEIDDWVFVTGHYSKTEYAYGTCETSGNTGWFPIDLICFEGVYS